MRPPSACESGCGTAVSSRSGNSRKTAPASDSRSPAFEKSNVRTFSRIGNRERVHSDEPGDDACRWCLRPSSPLRSRRGEEPDALLKDSVAILRAGGRRAGVAERVGRPPDCRRVRARVEQLSNRRVERRGNREVRGQVGPGPEHESALGEAGMRKRQHVRPTGCRSHHQQVHVEGTRRPSRSIGHASRLAFKPMGNPEQRLGRARDLRFQHRIQK